MPAMIKGIRLPLAILFFLSLSPADASPSSGLDITVRPPKVGQGELSLLTVGKKGEAKPEVIWMRKKIALVKDKKNGIWSGLIGADLTTRPGRYKLEIRLAGTEDPFFRAISVIAKDHGTRHLTLPREMVELDPPALKRARDESRRVMEILMRSDDYPFWSGRWIRPVPGELVGPFGCRSIINGVERSPHSGVDLKAAEGTPVLASNSGVVALVEDHFFSGRSVIIDHGGGIQSMYFHLSKTFVRVGDLIEKGATLGLSGSTGRVTGPHLHFGIRLNGRRVNPLSLIEISRRLER